MANDSAPGLSHLTVSDFPGNLTCRHAIAIVLGLSVLNAWATPLFADDKSMVAAAAANAVDSLRDEVAAERISPRLTVGEFLKRTGGEQQLRDVLERAEEIGGPRLSANGQACQIRVQITGDRVARELISIAASHPKQSPVAAEVMSHELGDWQNRVFSGTGSSISGGSAKFIRPTPTAVEDPQSDPWAGVSDAARQQAVDAARDDAVQKELGNLAPVQYTATQTVGQLMTNHAIHDPIVAWLGGRPVRQVRFMAQRQVEITLWIPGNEMSEQVLQSARLAKGPAPSPAEEAVFRKQVTALPSEVIGRATAPVVATTSAAVAIDLPSQPPSWTEEQLVAEGIAEPRASKLKTARAAEAAARDAMRKQVNALRLSDTLTVGDAVERSDAVDRNVTRVVNAARPFKVEYRADGSVLVRSTINSRELWMAIVNPQ